MVYRLWSLTGLWQNYMGKSLTGWQTTATELKYVMRSGHPKMWYSAQKKETRALQFKVEL